jgi:hypothetical protein
MENDKTNQKLTHQTTKRPSGRDCLRQESHQPEEFINEIVYETETVNSQPARL